MYRKDRPGTRGDRGLDAPWVEGEPFRIDVTEHGAGAGHHDGQRRISGRQRRRDDLVAGADAERAQGQGDCVGSSADANRESCAHGGCELRFERLDFGTQNEPAAGNHAIDGRAHIGRVFVRHERHERHAMHRHTTGRASAVTAGTYRS